MSAATTVMMRSDSVRQVLANHAIEGFEPDAQDRANLTAYVLGTLDAGDLLAKAREYVASVRAGIAVCPVR